MSASVAPPVPLVVERAQAEKVVDEVLRQVVYAKDEGALAKAETGALLDQSKTIQRLGGRNDAELVRSEQWVDYLIPTEREQPGYPRSFVAQFRSEDIHNIGKDRAAGLYYFVQEEAGGPWKAAAKSWAPDKPAAQPMPGPGGERLYGNWGFGAFSVRDAPVAAPARDEAGAAVLSPTAAKDREVCGHYAEYLSFTAPDGEPKSEHFVAGKLTSDVVTAYNAEAKVKGWEGLRFRFAFKASGVDLPVLRLADGKALVTCTFTQTARTDSKPGGNWDFSVGGTGPTHLANNHAATLMGGGPDARWTQTTIRRSVTATFEVPARGPSDVVGCNCLNPPVLTADGTPK
ncbi:hypothetical protein ACIA8F_24025 [Streptomyces sp. NPDC051563]|uniref:hypothetical protein n=1 Tax=Streptomyces sp. NPDC051563 TaxID=3365659 RepID=UPI00378C110E